MRNSFGLLYNLYGVIITMIMIMRNRTREGNATSTRTIIRDHASSLLPTPVRIPSIHLRMISLEIHFTPGSPSEVSHERHNEGSKEHHEADDHDEVPIWGIDTVNRLIIDRLLLALMRYSDIHSE